MIQNEQFWTHWNSGEFEQALRSKQQQTTSKPVNLLFGSAKNLKETATISILSAGEFIYDYIMINPQVVQGLDFARSEDLSQLFTLQQFATSIDTATLTGDMAQLQGYVAEQMIASELQAQGYDVQFPETSNNPGWDFLIDGAVFQVKSLSSASGVHEHFDKYPDIPVYVNVELAKSFADNPLVYSTSVSREEVLLQTRETLDHAEDLLNFELPWMSFTVSSIQNGWRMKTEQVKLQTAVRNVVTEVASRTALAGLGKVTLGTAGVALFGPAGGIVAPAIGAFIGVSQGGRLASSIKRTFAKKQYHAVTDALQQLIVKTQIQLEKKRNIKENKWQTIRSQSAQTAASKTALDALNLYYNEQKQYNDNVFTELQALANSSEQDPFLAFEHYLAILAKSNVHPFGIEHELKQVAFAMKNYARSV